MNAHKKYTERIVIIRMLVAVIALVIISGCLSGCGKKAPPYLPAQDSVPAAKDLKADLLDGGRVRLTWSVPEDQKSHPVRKFSVYRSKKTVFMTDCKKCPVLFDKIADVRVRADPVITYTDKIDEGYRYLYKVKAFTDSASGPDSDMIEFVY